MQISTKSRYAVRAMIELALNYKQGPLSLKEIARRQALSEKYLEQIAHPLRAKGLIFSQKGNRGGYSLSKPPSEITVYDIVTIMEGSITPVACVDNPQSCDRFKQCAVNLVWSRLKDRISEELRAHTLAELAAEEAILRKPGVEEINYHI